MLTNPKPFRIFYGWWIVVACFFIWLAVAGIVLYGFTTLFEPIRDEFGWSYTQISLAASLRGMEVGFLSPLMGFFADRSGPRKLMLIGTACLGLGLILLSQVHSLAMFYGAFVLIGIGGSTCTGAVPMTALANWFRKKVSIATGVMTCGSAFSGLLIPIIVKLMDAFGWRTTIVILGISVFVIILPLSFVVRHKPESCGYLPDGDTENINPGEVSRSVPATDRNISTRAALRSGTFWRISISFVLFMVVVNAIITHIMPFLSSVGITRSIASFTVTAMTLVTVVGRLGSGWFGDRLDGRWITSVNFVAMALGMLVVSYVSSDTVWLLVPFIVLFSIGYGGNFIMSVALIKQYFGRTNFGAIIGVMMGMVAFGGVIGPLVAGMVVDRWGSYQALWLAFAGLAIVSIIGVATARTIRVSAANLV